MNILITGANGQLGNEMRIIASRYSKRHEISNRFFFTDVNDASEESIAMLYKLAGDDVDLNTTNLDITDINSIRAIVKENNINVIVNCAAYTNVDAAEDHYDLAELLNADAPESLAKVMKEVNGLLVHISTDYVFGKDPYNTPCKENQKGTPTGVYGLTKLHGEENIKSSGCDYVIIRTAWLYSEFGKNFVKTMLNLTASKPQLNVVFDQVGTPTYAYDLATVIDVVLSDYASVIANLSGNPYPKTGIYHFSNEGVSSWYDFTKMIAEYSGNLNCDITPCHSDEFPSKVSRPSFSVLDKSKIKRVFKITVPYWIDSLRLCISRMSNYDSE